MKKIFYTHVLILLTLFCSCDLLDIKPVNSMLPVSVEDFESVLLGGYPRSDFFINTDLATDNVYANLNATSAVTKSYEPWFVWAATHQYNGAEDGYWKQLYQSIFYANTVLDEFAGKTPSAEEKNLFETVRGEAYALRAYCYFYLVNYYAENYATENMEKPGVPMPLSAKDVHQNTQNNVRIPVGKVWEQIEKDLEEGKKVIQETRRWDDNKEYSYAMRSKEDAQDYRYFPEPDLVPIVISDEWIAEIKARQPELRTEKLERYKKEFGLPDYDAEIITGHKKFADLFEATTEICKKPKKVSNWIMGEIIRLLKENEMDPEDIQFSPVNLAKVIELADSGAINSTVAKEVFEEVFKHDIDPDKYVEEKGLKTVNDAGELQAVVEQVIRDNPQSVEDYRNGKEKAIGFLVGQTMKAMKGKANPGMVNKILKELL